MKAYDGLSRVRSALAVRGRLKRLTAEALWVMAQQAGAVVAAFIGVKLLTRLLGPAEFGNLAVDNTIMSFVGTTAFGAFGQGLLRFHSVCSDQGQLRSFYALGHRLTVTLGLATFALVALAMALSWIVGQRGHVPSIAASSLAGLFAGLLGLKTTVFLASRQRKTVALLSVADALLRPLVASLLILAIAPKSLTALCGYCVATLAVFCLAELLYHREAGLAKGDPANKARDDADVGFLWKEMWAYSWPFVVWAGAGWVHLSCDRWVLRAFYGPAVVGAFAVVSQLSVFPLTFGSGFLTSLFGPIAFQRAGDLKGEGNLAGASRVLVLTTAIYVVGLAALVGIFAACHDWLVLLVSNESFLAYAYLLPWMTLAWGLFYLGQILVQWGFLVRKTASYIMPKCCAACIALVLSIALAPQKGPAGIVWALGAAGLVYAVWCGYIAVKVMMATRPSILEAAVV